MWGRGVMPGSTGSERREDIPMPGNSFHSNDRTVVKLELAEDDRPPATLTIEEYYSHLWRPDCDFVDGRSEERNVGILNQQIVITAMMVTTNDRRDEWRALMLPSLRLRVSPTRVRVADLCLISDDAPHEQVPTHPPILVIEVLDEEDRYCATMEKLDDYERFGVEHIWLVDPERRLAYRYKGGNLEMVQTGELAVPGTPSRVDLGEAFADINEWANCGL